MTRKEKQRAEIEDEIYATVNERFPEEEFVFDAGKLGLAAVRWYRVGWVITWFDKAIKLDV